MHEKVEGVPVFHHPLVAKWVFGDRSQHPPWWSLVPLWDFFVVLVALTEEPFEPLWQTLPRFLTLKAIFLLATASAHMFSGIALCIDHLFLIRNSRPFRLVHGGVPFLAPRAYHLLARAYYLLQPINLHLLCSVHALCIYLHPTALCRGQNRSLFVYWDEGKDHRPVSTHWISSCFSEAIHSTYHHLGREHETLHANNHLIRGVAASWAEIAT